METSHLEVTQKVNNLGIIESRIYKIVGKSPYINIAGSDIFLETRNDYEKIKLGPYTLLKVDIDYSRDIITYVRSDRFGYVRVLFYKLTRGLDLAYRRFIITLAVWKLANYDPAVIPSWRDIKLFK